MRSLRWFAVLIVVGVTSLSVAIPGGFGQQQSSVSSFKLEQISFEANYSGLIPCSENGHAEFIAAPDPGSVYFIQVVAKLPTGNPAWVVQNLPVLYGAAYGQSPIQTSTTVDLAPLGVSSGTCIDGTTLTYSLALTSTLIDNSPPFSPAFSITVGSRVDNAEGSAPLPPSSGGSSSSTIFPPPSGKLELTEHTRSFSNSALGLGEGIGRPRMGNVEQGNYECCPSAMANSLHWLAATGAINLGSDTPEQSREKLKEDMQNGPWMRCREMVKKYKYPPPGACGVIPEEVVEGKLRFAASHNLNLEIHYQADSGLSGLGKEVKVGDQTATRDGAGGAPDWDYLLEQMRLGQDVELDIVWIDDMGNITGGHCVAVSGIYQEGKVRKIAINDDENQGNAGGLRTNHWADVGDNGGYLELKGLNAKFRNRVRAIYAESPTVEFSFRSDLFLSLPPGSGPKDCEVFESSALFATQTLDGNPPRKFLAVANEGTNSLSIIDLVSRESRTVAVGSQPHSVDVTPDGRWAFVGNFGSGSVSVVDLVQLRVIETVRVGNQPTSLAFDPNFNRIYTTNFGDGTVTAIQADEGRSQLVATIRGIREPLDVKLSPDGRRGYVSTQRSELVVFDAMTFNVLRRISLGAVELRKLAVSPDGGRLYVTTRSGNTGQIAVVDTSDLQVIQQIPVDALPFGLTVHPLGRWLIVTHAATNRVSFVDLLTGQVGASFTDPLNKEPQVAAIAGYLAYITNRVSSTISVYCFGAPCR